MTERDRLERQPGYWPSPWPVECGGNRRQKATTGRLDATAGTTEVVTVRNDRWNVMVIGREPGEWFLGGTMAAFSGPPPFGWVQRIDPETMQPRATSPELPCGDHVWCGAILAYANGSIMSVNGSYLHRLDPVDLTVEAERKLPVDRSHNGLLALADGTLITKDLRLEGQGGTTITRLDPDSLDLVADPLVLPVRDVPNTSPRTRRTGQHPRSNPPAGRGSPESRGLTAAWRRPGRVFANDGSGENPITATVFGGGPGRTRTCDLRIMSPYR